MINALPIIFLLFVLFAVIGFFSSSETAYLSLTKIKVREMIRTKRKNARMVAKLHGNIESLLTLVLVGTNFVNSFSTALATMLAISLVGEHGVGIATLVIAFCTTTFGQIIPKTLAVNNPSTTAANAAPALNFLRKVFFPVIWIFTAVSKSIVFLFDKIWKEESTGAGVTEEELQLLFAVGEREGTLEKAETRMLNKVFEFSDLSVHDIMRHRSFLRGVPKDADYNSVVASFAAYGYSHLVVYEPQTENVVGVINYKSVLFGEVDGKISGDAASVGTSAGDHTLSGGKCFAEKIMEPPLFIPETFTPFELLEKFQENGKTFAVVLDEQGETAGIATVDDVMRVVFDRMTDDNLTANLPPEERVKIINEKEFIVPGDMKISDVNEFFNFNLQSEEFNTIGGWLLEQFGSLPRAGEICISNSKLFIVEDQSQRRIKSVRIKF